MQNGSRKSVWLRSTLTRSLFSLKKKNGIKNPKICIFLKGLVHGFCQKLRLFSSFCFNAKWIKEKCLVMFLNEKTSLHEYEKHRFKKGPFAFSKKGLVHGLGKKKSEFFFFCVNAKLIEKKCLVKSKMKKSLFRL